MSLSPAPHDRLKCDDCDAYLPYPPRRRLIADDKRPGIPVEVKQAPINTANYQITADMIFRFYNNGLSVYDPCIICGVKFNNCPHDLSQTEIVARMIKRMGKAERDRILKK